MRSGEGNAVGVVAKSVGDGDENVGDVTKNFGDLGQLAECLKEIASPIERDEKIGVIIARAATRCGLTYWRVFNIWYGKAKHASSEECRVIAIALQGRRRELARNELQDLWSRLTRLESQLAQIDPDFHRDTIAHAKQQRRALE